MEELKGMFDSPLREQHIRVIAALFGKTLPIGGALALQDSIPDTLDTFQEWWLKTRSNFRQPYNGSWDIADSRGSLLLLCDGYDLIVCEPLTGLYQRILWPGVFRRRLGVFLLDGDDADRRVSMSNFRVLAAFDETTACIFSTGGDGGWRLVSSAIAGDIELPSTLGPENFVGRANGTVYWGIEGSDTDVLVLAESTAEFSIAAFPETVWWPSHRGISRVVGGDDGVLRVIRLINNELKVFARRHPDSDGDEWLLEMHLRLPEATLGLPGRKESFFQQEAMIVSANARYVLLTPSEETWLFSVELDTMRVEREHERNKVCYVVRYQELSCMVGVALPSAQGNSASAATKLKGVKKRWERPNNVYKKKIV
ncbi:hypothetical protein TRIUR3_02778 [Triticum urartu]|uniref:DUF1618 domain-containing protein n=1 Tax=Triticum urartu TaxID=4572 RepID=M7ZDW3_TRIUA|nr:hypothetical protein TRIUR3_02778 [Triticum urartu]